MKLKKTKLLSLIMAAALVFESAGMNVVAANNTVNDDAAQVSIEETYDVSEGDLSEESEIGGTTDGDVSEGDVQEPVADVTDGDVSEGDVQEPAVDVTGGDVSEGDVTEGDVANLFPGLPGEYVLTEKQIADKAELAEYAGEYTAENSNSAQSSVGTYVEGQILYLTESEEEAQAIAAAFGGELESYELGVAVICLSENRTVPQALAAAADLSTNLPAVWPNFYREELANDPALTDAKEGTAQESGYQWHHKFIGSSAAWAAGYTGKGIKVAVLDSGVLNGHVEFSGRLQKHLNMTNVTSASGDETGHGTHVSGIIAANINNNKGGAGVAPEAALYVYGLRDGQGVMTSGNILRGINQAVVDKIDVVNMSFGGCGYSAYEEQVMTLAYESGVALFAAAGNESSNGHLYPASYDNIISIAALDRDGKKAGFTTYNNKVDLSFPGAEIYSTYNNGGFTYMNGTSMACPVAAGVAAVILSGANDIPELKDKTGSDRVDALLKVMGKYAQKSSSAGTGKGYTYLPDVWGLTVDEMDQVPEAPKFGLPNKSVINDTKYYLEITSATTKGVTIYYNRTGGTPKFKDGKVTGGYELTGNSLYLSGQKSRTVKAIAVNHITGKASKVTTATYYFKPNPTSVSITSVNGTYAVVPGGKVTLKASVSPAYAISNKVAWSVEGAPAGITVKNGKVTVAKTATAGTYNIVATAVDSKGNAFTNGSGAPVQRKFTLVVMSSSDEVKSVKFGNKKATATVGVKLSLLNDVTVTYKDKNKSPATGAAANLVWTSSNTSIADVDSQGNVIAYAPGKVTIKATVNDGRNKSASCTVTVAQLAEYVSISSTVLVLAKGKSGQMYANFDPSYTTNKNVEWSVAPVGAAAGSVTINAKGKMSAGKDASGTWRVTCKTTDGSNLTATRDVPIVNEAVKSITVASKKIDLQVNIKAGAKSTAPMNATITGGDAAGAVRYFSSNEAVASVDWTTGMITAHGSGKATITAYAYDGGFKRATVTVNVSVPMSSVEIIPADENSISVDTGTMGTATTGIVCVGSSIKLTTVAGSSYGNAQNKNVIWSVAEADKDKVTISNKGVLKAKSVGTVPAGQVKTTVTVYAEAADGSGAKDSYTVWVYPKITSVRSVYSSSDKAYAVLVKYQGVSGEYYCVATSIKASAPSKYEVGVTNSGATYDLSIDKDTTNKTGYFYTSDACPVTLKIRPLGSNKTLTKKIYVIKNGNYIWYAE